MNKLKTMSTVELVNLLCETNSQALINAIAYELTCRIYIPDNSEGVTFEEMLTEFGYKKINTIERNGSITR